MNNKIKLIVTDDASEFTQENLNILQSKNISVIFCAKDGEELCDKIKRENPDVVLMDSFMTRLDAIGVMRSITRESTKVPVFMGYSSFHSTVLEREIMNSGASYFVLKPYNISELSTIISDLSDLSKKNNFSRGRVIDAFGIEMKVTDILHEIGVPAHIKGYHYLRDSIIMSVEHPEIINAVTKQLYPSVAKKYENGKFYTNGGRVLGVTATADTLDEALEKAYAAVEKISFEGAHYRHDIGKTK